MIAVTASHSLAAPHVPGPLARDLDGDSYWQGPLRRPVVPVAICGPIGRAAFIARSQSEVRGLAGAVNHADGYALAGRRYVAVACHSPDPRGCGWAMVHDDPDALSHFHRLFGEPA